MCDRGDGKVVYEDLKFHSSLVLMNIHVRMGMFIYLVIYFYRKEIIFLINSELKSFCFFASWKVNFEFSFRFKSFDWIVVQGENLNSFELWIEFPVRWSLKCCDELSQPQHVDEGWIKYDELNLLRRVNIFIHFASRFKMLLMYLAVDYEGRMWAGWKSKWIEKHAKKIVALDIVSNDMLLECYLISEIPFIMPPALYLSSTCNHTLALRIWAEL